jgi:hypothetical protein
MKEKLTLLLGFGMVAFGVVMADLVSIDQIAIASGFLTFSVGIAALSGGPLAGMLFLILILLFDDRRKNFSF